MDGALDSRSDNQTDDARHQILFKTMQQGVVYQDVDGRILDANPAACRILGLTPDRMQGRTWCHPGWKAVDADGTPLAGDRHAAAVALKTGEPARDFVHAVVHPETGAYTWLRAAATPLFRDGGERPYLVHTVFEDITATRRSEAQLRAGLAEKELLLAEVHHRVKNNMAAITGLLALQAGCLDDPSAATALLDAQRRVNSMTALYDLLYRSRRFCSVNLSEYLGNLTAAAVDLFTGSRRVTVTTRFDNPDSVVDAGIAFPVGMIVNELLTNSFKHAFPGDPRGSILLAVECPDPALCRVTYHDNGIGLPDAVLRGDSTGLGVSLVTALAEQIDARMLMRNESGMRLEMTFPRAGPAR